MPVPHRQYSNMKRDLVYISPNKKVAYCKVPKVGTNSWGGFFARAGKFRKMNKIDFYSTLIFIILVLGSERKFEKKFHVKIGNRTLDEIRCYYGFIWEDCFPPTIKLLCSHKPINE